MSTRFKPVQLLPESICRNYVHHGIRDVFYIFPAVGFGGGASSPGRAEDVTDHPRSVVRHCAVLHFDFWIGEPSHTHSPIRRVSHNWKRHLQVTKGKIRKTNHFQARQVQIQYLKFHFVSHLKSCNCCNCFPSCVQLRKENLERTDDDNEVNNRTRKEKEEGIMWNKVRTLLQDCTDVYALTQVGYISICFIR